MDKPARPVAPSRRRGHSRRRWGRAPNSSNRRDDPRPDSRTDGGQTLTRRRAGGEDLRLDAGDVARCSGGCEEEWLGGKTLDDSRSSLSCLSLTRTCYRSNGSGSGSGSGV